MVCPGSRNSAKINPSASQMTMPITFAADGTVFALFLDGECKWEVLPHPSYSPDVAPSDYHLFGYMKDQLRQRRQSRKQCVSVFGWLEPSFTAGEFSKSQNAGKNVYKELAIMWKNKEKSVD